MGSSHSHHKKSSSTANTYSVSTNNWLDTTTKAVADNSTNQQSSLILSPNPDPAYGCNKQFVSSYSCGPNTTLKTISLDSHLKSHHSYTTGKHLALRRSAASPTLASHWRSASHYGTRASDLHIYRLRHVEEHHDTIRGDGSAAVHWRLQSVQLYADHLARRATHVLGRQLPIEYRVESIE